jgi:hypothetical protein
MEPETTQIGRSSQTTFRICRCNCIACFQPRGKNTTTQLALYLNSMFVHDMSSGNSDVTDRCSRGLQGPWDSASHHVYILNKPK